MAESTVKIVFLGDASKLKRELDDIDGKVDKSGGAFDRFGKQSVPGVAAIGVAAGAAFVHFGTMGNALEAMGKKAETVFEGSKGEIDQWADANAKAMGLTDDQLTGLAANFGDLLKPMGFTADQAADMSKDVVGLSGALSAWSGGTTSSAEASDILAKAMLGERDGLKSLGISISEADVQARLAKNGTEKLTGAALEQAKAVATQELIFEKSTDAQKAWSDGSMDAIKSQNSIKSSMGELQEQIANRLQPAFAALTGWLVDTAIPAFDQFSGWVRDNWPQIQEVIENVMARVRAVIETVLGAIEAFWRTWGGTITAYLQGLWEGIRQVIEGALRVVQGVINVVMGLIHGDFSRVWDGIRQIFSGVWEAINGLVDLAINEVRTRIEIVMRLIAGVFDTAWEGIKSVTSDALGAVVGFFTALPGRIIGAIGDIGGKVWGAISAGWNAMQDNITKPIGDAIVSILTWFTNLPGQLRGMVDKVGSAAYDIGKGLIDGVKNGISGLIDAAGDFAGAIVNALKGIINTQVIDRINSALEVKISLGPLGDISINPPDIPRLARGGITSGPMLALIGDNPSGKEAVIPLDSSGKPPWGSSGNTFIINVYGSRSPQATADTVQRTLMSNQMRVALAGA